MKRFTKLALTLTGATLLATPVMAQDKPAGVEVGKLTCVVEQETNFIVGSKAVMNCTFDRVGDGPASYYTATVSEYGLDIGTTDSATLIWGVVAPTADLEVGALEGVPIVLTTLTLLVAGQLVLGRTSIWLPSFVRNRGFPKQKVKSIIDKLTPYAEHADRYLGQRLAMFAGETASRIVAAFCIFLSLLVYPATLLPFAVALPGSAILLLSLGLLVRDGVVTLVGLMVALAAVATVVYWLA
eukprot:g20834.t1